VKRRREREKARNVYDIAPKGIEWEGGGVRFRNPELSFAPWLGEGERNLKNESIEGGVLSPTTRLNPRAQFALKDS